MSLCPNCGTELGSGGCPNPNCPSKTYYGSIKLYPEKKTGWICPICGGGVSPYIDKCPCKHDFTVTSTPYWPEATGGDF